MPKSKPNEKLVENTYEPHYLESMVKSLKEEEFNDLIKPLEVKHYRKDILGYYGRPADTADNYDEYYRSLLDTAIENFAYKYDFDEKLTSDERQKAIEDDVAELKQKLNTDISAQSVICIIKYPLEITAYIIFYPEDYDITYGQILYLYTKAYQLVYKLEEEEDGDPSHIPNMLNRLKSNGPFGIWGHDITDLVYNGGSDIIEYENVVTCEFDCDS